MAALDVPMPTLSGMYTNVPTQDRAKLHSISRLERRNGK